MLCWQILAASLGWLRISPVLVAALAVPLVVALEVVLVLAAALALLLGPVAALMAARPS